MTKKIIIFLLFAVLANVGLVAQLSKNIMVEEKLRVYSAPNIDQLPYFGSCKISAKDKKLRQVCTNENLRAYINDQINYPPLAKKYNISKTVMVHAIILKNGLLVNLIIDDGRNKHITNFQKEARRIVNSMNEPTPQWAPAKIKGNKVNSYVRIPVRFKPD